MDACEHLCHLPQPSFSIARQQVDLPRQMRHQERGTTDCRVHGRPDHARGWNAATFKLGKDRRFFWHRANNPLVPLAAGHPPTEYILFATAIALDRHRVDERRETAGEPLPSDDSDAAEGLFHPSK
jgi:hypothetical protein